MECHLLVIYIVCFATVYIFLHSKYLSYPITIDPVGSFKICTEFQALKLVLVKVQLSQQKQRHLFPFRFIFVCIRCRRIFFRWRWYHG